MKMKKQKKSFIIILLLFLLVGTIVICCGQKQKDKLFKKEFSFDRNLVNTKEPEFVCQLSEDSVLLKGIKNFTILNDTSFVVADGRGVYLYHISGTFKKQFGNLGQAGGEMIRPSIIYATSDYVYIWCSSMMKFLIFDHEANFKYELTGFKRAVSKFVVNSSDEILYLYTAGFFDELNNKMFDVIEVFNISDKSSKTFGERGPEDEVLSTYSNSSGLYIDMDRLIYLHPGNLIIYDHDLNSDETVRYKIDDKTFNTTTITSNVRDIMENFPKLADYLYKNSAVIDLYKDNDQFFIVSEIGQFDFDIQSGVMNTKERKVKLYILDSSFTPNRTILFDYISSPNIVIYSGAMYFLTLNLGETDQTITLNRFSLVE